MTDFEQLKQQAQIKEEGTIGRNSGSFFCCNRQFFFKESDFGKAIPEIAQCLNIIPQMIGDRLSLLQQLSDAWRALNRDIPSFEQWVKFISDSLEKLEEVPLLNEVDLTAVMSKLEVNLKILFEFFYALLYFI